MNYDSEGYCSTTGIHKRLGIRRNFRPTIDTPVTPEEAALVTKTEEERTEKERLIAACFNRAPATEQSPYGGHRIVPHSHEEIRCINCGAYFPQDDIN
ncbi:MAG: hypothetical protein RBR08_14580 [Desulforegulaceae bacterium]|nr:hypothetical protein [Desulforegulaceae bacterium]